MQLVMMHPVAGLGHAHQSMIANSGAPRILIRDRKDTSTVSSKRYPYGGNNRAKLSNFQTSEPSDSQFVPCSVRCCATSSERCGFASFMRATAEARSG